MIFTVRQAWPAHIAAYEGRTTWLYWDTHVPPLPTTGTGNMIGSPTGLSKEGLALPWRDEQGEYASEGEIAAEAARLRKLNIKGSGYDYRRHASLFLDDPVVDWLLLKKTDDFWAILKQRLPEIESWPADAQLALMNMAWWMGPNFLASWPNLTAALKAQDWLRAAANCTTVNRSRRNPDNVVRFETAARVAFAGLPALPLYNPYIECARTPVHPDHPLGPFDARLSITAAAVKTAKPSVASVDIWYVQRMLKLTGHYSSKLDGLRGPVTEAAMKAWAKSRKISYASTPAVLSELSAQSGVRIPVK